MVHWRGRANADERRYLDALRAFAEGADWDIDPEDTLCMTFGVPLYLAVDIPAMRRFPGSRAARQLEIALWPPDSHGGLRLDGFWGNRATPMDFVWVLERGKLLVVGVDARPEVLADWTFRWLGQQLNRHLRLKAWKAGGAAATTEGTSEKVGVYGGPWRRIGAPIKEAVLEASRADDFF